MKHVFSRCAVVALMAFSGLACSKGGNIVIEPGSRPPLTKGSPFVTLNHGGKALVIEQGKTQTTGVHGFINIQAVQTSALDSAGGVKAVINKNPVAP